VPVKYVDGRWEYWFGGAVPVETGAFGELILSRGSITDAAFLKAMNERSAVKVLDAGSELLVTVTVKESTGLSVDLKRHLIASNDAGYITSASWSAGETFFIKATLKSSDQAGSLDRRHGLWLLMQGSEPIGFDRTLVSLPMAVDELFLSLKHALTKISETYEPWRISHTGNVYRRIFTEKQTADGIH
jgi:hypothetical protein